MNTMHTMHGKLLVPLVAGGMLALFLAILSPSAASAASPCAAANIRWAGSSNNVYVSGDIMCTLTEIKALGSKSIPLALVDAPGKVWFLGANLILQDGATLTLHGGAIGGDVNELRLKSNNVSGGFVIVRADWGKIHIDSTKVTSWDEAANGPDTEYGTYGRAFMGVRSRLVGGVPRESRMDITNSDVGYLGYDTAEAYGLVWKVSSGSFDAVGVFGDVTGNSIHHNYFGLYTYGAQAMTFIGNEVFENVKYGIDPHDDSDYLVIEENNVHDNGSHGIICSQRCNNISIVGNTSVGNTGNGIMLHRNTNDSLVEGNVVHDNSDSGIAVFDSHRNTLRNNTITGNEKGIRLSVGSSENIVEDNVISDSEKYGLYFYKGSDAPTSGNGRPKLNVFRRNTVSGSGSVGAKIQQADGNTFEDNSFTGGASYVGEISDSNGNTIRGGVTSGNANNYYYAKSQSVNAIQNADDFAVKIGDTTSSMAIADATNAVLMNSKNIPTTVSTVGSSLTLTRTNAGSSVVTFNRLELVVVPASGNLTVKPLIWNIGGDYSKKWTVSGGPSSSVAAAHTVGDLNPGTTYSVSVNGSAWNSFVANASGTISFSYTAVFSSTKTFEVSAAL